LSGEVQMTMGGPGTSAQQFATGKLKPLALAKPDRLPDYPNVPTLKEAGYADIDPHPWFGLFAPGGTPPALLEKIQTDVAVIIRTPDFHEREIINKGFSGVGSTPTEFAAFLRSDLQSKGRLIKISGAKAE